MTCGPHAKAVEYVALTFPADMPFDLLRETFQSSVAVLCVNGRECVRKPFLWAIPSIPGRFVFTFDYPVKPGDEVSVHFDTPPYVVRPVAMQEAFHVKAELSILNETATDYGSVN